MKDILAEAIVIVPIYNEALNAARVVGELRGYLGQNVDILIVDDCSTDGTGEILRNLDVIVVTLPFNLGYSGALQTGYKYAVLNDYKYVIQFDGDGQHIAEEIGKLVSEFEDSRADVVIGSRFIVKGQYHYPFLKKVATHLFCFLINIITGSTIYDPTSGFQLLNRKTFRHYSTLSNFPYYPDANIIIEMLLNGYRIREVHVRMRERIFGDSMHTGFIRQAKYVINLLYGIFIIMLKYRPSTYKSENGE